MSSVENMRFRVKRAEEAKQLIESIIEHNPTITQQQIAHRIGVSQPTLSLYLSERIAPSVETLAQLRAYAWSVV